MKAYRLHEFGGPDALKCEEIPDPTPGPGQVLVRLRAASLNFRDLLVSKGLYNPKLKLPVIPLCDGAGEVVATGDGSYLLEAVQPQGRSVVDARSWRNGARPAAGERLGT